MTSPRDYRVPPATPAATVEEAEQRLLALLDFHRNTIHADLRRMAEDNSAAAKLAKITSDVISHVYTGIVTAYTEISGKPVPPELSKPLDPGAHLSHEG